MSPLNGPGTIGSVHQGRAVNKVLIVGQTPPPYGGQAIMIETMLKGVYPDVELYHIRMSFSSQMDEVGKFRIGKTLHLFKLILVTLYVCTANKIDTLYYPPAGPELVPVLRDVVYLTSVRWFFRRQILHYHASGLSAFYCGRGWFLRALMRMAYFGADISVCATERVSDDGRVLAAKRTLIVPLGIPDHAGNTLQHESTRARAPAPSILYVGVLREDKGILVLLEAFRSMLANGEAASLDLVGHFASTAFERQVKIFIAANQLEDAVRLHGVLTGDAKWDVFRAADLFCFPTYFPSESFGVCLIEAMSFSLPIVATRWRSIPEIVDDGENGFLVPIRDAVAMAEKLGQLARDRELRSAMGLSGRRKFLREFTLDKYYARINQIFQATQSDARSTLAG
jgi:glycosyltransferase involved in cell wall biosynthesis